MWKKKCKAVILSAALVTGIFGVTSEAAIDAKTAQNYDQAANMKANLSCFDVTVKETTTIPGQTEDAVKTVQMKVSGLQTDNLRVSIRAITDEGEVNQYYANGYLYTDESGEKIKYKMKQDEMLELMNYDVYLNLDSGRLATLESTKKNQDTVYSFSAMTETVGDYADMILEGVQEEHQVEIITIQGTMEVEEHQHMVQRNLQTVYMVQKDGRKQACIMTSEASFHNPGETVVVTMPDFSLYKEAGNAQAAVQVTKEYQTIYAVDSINIRAQNSITSAILGGASAGTALQQLGYTSDGWVQISYNGAVGYVSEEYVSTTKPVIVADMSGTMYAVTNVYVRDAASTDGAILGSLDRDDSVKVTGYTDNNWIRVRYNGTTAYVFAEYLTWEEPSRVVNGYMSGIVTGMTGSTITIQNTQGGSYTFDVSGAYMNLADGLAIGDRVDLSYNQKGNTLTATQVNDYTYHNSTGQNTEAVNDLVYGVVMAWSMNKVTVACDDGTSMTFSRGDAVVNGAPYVGAYVSAAYYYDQSIGDNRLTYISVI